MDKVPGYGNWHSDMVVVWGGHGGRVGGHGYLRVIFLMPRLQLVSTDPICEMNWLIIGRVFEGQNVSKV